MKDMARLLRVGRMAAEALNEAGAERATVTLGCGMTGEELHELAELGGVKLKSHRHVPAGPDALLLSPCIIYAVDIPVGHSEVHAQGSEPLTAEVAS